MKLNLHVLAAETRHACVWEPQGDPTKLALRVALPLPVSGTPLPDAVYVGRVEDLPSRVPDTPFEAICVGVAPSTWRKAPIANVVCVADDIDPGALLAEVTQVFLRYDDWECNLQDALLDDAPLSRFGALSRGLIRNPFFVTTEGFRILFSESEVLKHEDRAAYERYCQDMTGTAHPIESGAYAPMDTIRQLVSNPSTRDVFRSDGPIVYQDDNYPYDSLALNLGPDDARMGTLVMDCVVHELEPKDYAHVVMLGRFLERAIRRKSEGVVARTTEMGEVLTGLLEHRLISEQRIQAVVDRLGWQMHDTYLCLRLESRSYNRSELLYETLTPAAALRVPTECYVIFDGSPVLVANLTRMGLGRATALDGIEGFLERNLLVAGVSRTFDDFKDLYYYHRQCKVALGRLVAGGEGADTGGTPLACYEDVALGDLLARVTRREPVEAFLPQGLKALVEYDKAQGTELVAQLRAYLDNNMSVTATCRKTFTARNTCLYRVRRIREVSGLDLDDADVRLQLCVALRLMEGAQERQPR